MDTHLQAIERHFHALIRARAAEMRITDLPDLPRLRDSAGTAAHPDWFAVPGMYGGFAYWLDTSGAVPRLVAASWSRVVGGSGQEHVVTPAGAALVDEGFV